MVWNNFILKDNCVNPTSCVATQLEDIKKHLLTKYKMLLTATGWKITLFVSCSSAGCPSLSLSTCPFVLVLLVLWLIWSTSSSFACSSFLPPHWTQNRASSCLLRKHPQPRPVLCCLTLSVLKFFVNAALLKFNLRWTSATPPCPFPPF